MITVPSLLTVYLRTRHVINNNIRGFKWHVITHPYPNLNCGLAKLPTKWNRGWLIIFHISLWGLITCPYPLLEEDALVSVATNGLNKININVFYALNYDVFYECKFIKSAPSSVRINLRVHCQAMFWNTTLTITYNKFKPLNSNDCIRQCFWRNSYNNGIPVFGYIL